MIAEASLYEGDTVLWAVQQAAALRAAAASGSNLPIEWENVAEEIDDLAGSRRRELGGHMRLIIEDLLRLQHAPADRSVPRRKEEIVRARIGIERLLEESPSLSSTLSETLVAEHRRAAKVAAASMAALHELTPEMERRLDEARFTLDEVLGDWFPDEQG